MRLYLRLRLLAEADSAAALAEARLAALPGLRVQVLAVQPSEWPGVQAVSLALEPATRETYETLLAQASVGWTRAYEDDDPPGACAIWDRRRAAGVDYDQSLLAELPPHPPLLAPEWLWAELEWLAD